MLALHCDKFGGCIRLVNHSVHSVLDNNGKSCVVKIDNADYTLFIFIYLRTQIILIMCVTRLSAKYVYA